MTMKTLLLGAAAGLMTVGAAQAADLPMTKAEAVEYVKVCTEFGEGFFYIPGTDTCLRISGEVRADYKVFDTHSNDDSDAYDFTTEGRVKFDARTQTEYGLLRSFFQINARTGSNDSGASSGFAVDKAFIQFGGLTAGYAHTFFGIYDNEYGDTIFAGYFSSSSTVNLLAYTATFGGGFSATLSVEDGGEHESFLWNDDTNSIVSYGGKRIPDVVGQLRIDQEWGTAAVFAASHQIRYPASGTSDADDDFGFAAGAAVAVKLPFLAGSHFVVEGTYADGASNYLGAGSVADASFIPNIDSDLGHGWSVTSEFSVNITPALTAVVFGSYLDYKPGNVDGLVALVEDDFTAYVVGANLTYTVVKGLTVGAEVSYSKTDFDDVKATDAVFETDPDGSWAGGVRLKRTF
jgi:hypothetical protein